MGSENEEPTRFLIELNKKAYPNKRMQR